MDDDTIEYTCEVFVQQHSILDEKVGASKYLALFSKKTCFLRKVEDSETNLT